jgi:hypothetical protein
MPINKKMMASMIKEYGKVKGKKIYFATEFKRLKAKKKAK